MFERFTPSARRVIVLAQEEARFLNHNYIGTEHILLGLIREGDGVAAQVLVALGADLATVRQQDFQLLGDDNSVGSGRAGDTMADHAADEARMARQLVNARDVARRLWAHLPAQTRQKLLDDSTGSIPSWVRDQDGT